MDFHGYPFEMRRLDPEEGGGWLISFPDFPGCMSDGETPEEALANGQDALDGLLSLYAEDGRELPKPGEGAAGGRLLARIPRSMHARLLARAKQEGVSANMLVATFIAAGLGQERRG